MKKLNIYRAWARKYPGAFITTEIKATSEKNAKKWFKENGYQIDGNIYFN